MNLFLRLIFVAIKALMRKQDMPALNTSVLKFRVWLTDQDMFAHMTNSRYLSFSDLGTMNFIIRIGYMRIFQKRGWIPVICAQTMCISRMLTTPQSFEIHTRLAGWNDTYIGLHHTFIRNNRKHADVYVLARLASRDRKHPTPYDLVAAGNMQVESPAFSKPFLDLIAQADAARKTGSETVTTEPG